MPEPLAIELYERVGERVPRTGLLVYGLIRKAVACGYAGLWASHDEIGDLVGGSASAVKRNLAKLVELDLVVQVPLSVEREDATGRQRVANAYTLGTEGKAASPRRARWEDRPPRVQGSRRHRGSAGRNVDGEGADRGREGGVVSTSPPGSKTPSLLLSESGKPLAGLPGTPRRVDGRAARAASTASPATSAATHTAPPVCVVSALRADDRSGASGDAPSNAGYAGGRQESQSTIRTTATAGAGGAGGAANGTLGALARCSPAAAALLRAAGAPAPAVARSAREAQAAAAAALHDGADLARALRDGDPDVVAAAPWARGVMPTKGGAS